MSKDPSLRSHEQFEIPPPADPFDLLESKVKVEEDQKRANYASHKAQLLTDENPSRLRPTNSITLSPAIIPGRSQSVIQRIKHVVSKAFFQND